LNFLYFFLFLKNQIYKRKPTSIEELIQRVADEMSLIVDILRNVRDSFQFKTSILNILVDDIKIFSKHYNETSFV